MGDDKLRTGLTAGGDLTGSPLERRLRVAHRQVMKHHGHPPDGVLEADMVRAFLLLIEEAQTPN
jgi:hypothetical protein